MLFCKPTFQDLSHSVGSMPFIAFELFHDSVSCGAIDSNVNNSCSQKCSFVKVNVQFVHHWKRPAWLLLVHVSQCSWRPMLRFYWYMYLSALEGLCFASTGTCISVLLEAYV